MLKISNSIAIPENEIEFIAIRAQGAGGQNVNKVSSAVNLRFDIHQSSLSQVVKERLLMLRDYRITSSGIINIKSQRYRTQFQNKLDAIERLKVLILKATIIPKERKLTKATKASKINRLAAKTQRAKIKSLRKIPRDYE